MASQVLDVQSPAEPTGVNAVAGVVCDTKDPRLWRGASPSVLNILLIGPWIAATKLDECGEERTKRSRTSKTLVKFYRKRRKPKTVVICSGNAYPNLQAELNGSA